MRIRPTSSMVIAALALSTAAVAQQSGAPADVYWLDIQLKARSMLADPAVPTALDEVMDPLPEPMGVLSPDGKKVAFIGSDPQRVKDGHDFDLFVADVDAAQPSGKANVRRLTTDHANLSSVHWLADSSGLVFAAGEAASQQVWYVSLEENAKPARLSDGTHRAFDISVLPSGRVAWSVHKGSRKKEQFIDLVVHPSPSSRGKMQTLLTDQHISSYAISPDEKTLAWSGLGSLFLVDLASGTSREIPLHGVHRRLINHSAQQISWRPDGKVLAIHCGFLGGISRGLNADPNQPWPRMFAEDKVFFIPVDWRPTPESLVVTNENFPSPTADDPQAEASPPAGDQSKPWWVRELPMRPLGLAWIRAAEARERIDKNASER